MASVTAERIFDYHAVALGLPPSGGRDLVDYIADHGDTKEGTRCLTEAAEAAAIADHGAVAHWLQQARQHMPSLKK